MLNNDTPTFALTLENEPRNTQSSTDIIIIDQVYPVIDVVVNCFVVIVLSFLGVIGNAINIVVFYRQGVAKDSINILLLSLSVSDMLFSLTLFMRRLSCPVSYFDEAAGLTMESVSMLLLASNRLMLTTSINLIGVVAIERAVAVLSPFKVARIFTPSKVKAVVLGIYAYQVLITSPFFYLFKFKWVFNQRLNATVAQTELTDFYVNNYSILNFVGLVLINNLTCTLNMIFVLVSGAAISIKLLENQKSRRKMTKKDVGYDVRVVKMLMVVCAICFVVFLPSGIIDTYSYFVPNFVFLNRLYTVLQFFCDLLYAINASVNFVIYLRMSSNYASTFSKLVADFKKSTGRLS